MKLEDIIPESATFSLRSTGKTYELRTPNLEDRVRMSKLGDIPKMFGEKRWDEVCKVIYPLLKDKSDFMASKQEMIDDDGFKKEAYVTGPICLLRAIETQDELIQVLTAFNSAISKSEPLVKEYMNHELKKNLSLSQTGENFLTSSPQSTDTPPSSSENLPTEKLT